VILEPRAADHARTIRLLAAAETAFEGVEPATELDADFEAVVMEGLLAEPAVYPPAGHTYPRRD